VARPGVLEWGSRRGRCSLPSGKGSEVPLPSGVGSGEGLCPYLRPSHTFFDFLDQNGAFDAVYFRRAMHMQRMGIALYMLGSGVCLSRGGVLSVQPRSSELQKAPSAATGKSRRISYCCGKEKSAITSLDL